MDLPYGPPSIKDDSMKRLFAAGALLAVLAFLLIAFGDALGLDLSLYALFGLAIGVVLAALPGGTPITRVVGFLFGFAVAWVGYALRAGFLPDAAIGRAIGAVIVVIVLTTVAALLRSRVLFACEFLGAAALAGAYETTFNSFPTEFLSQSVVAATTILLASALGFLATTLLGGTVLHEGDFTDEPAPLRPSSPAQTSESGIEILHPTNS